MFPPTKLGSFTLVSSLVLSKKLTSFLKMLLFSMEQHTLKNINNCLNTNIYSYLETSGGQSSNPYLNVVHFFITSVY